MNFLGKKVNRLCPMRTGQEHTWDARGWWPGGFVGHAGRIPTDPHEHRNCLWDGCDHVSYDLVLLCSRFLGMQIATYIVAHLLVPLY